MPAYVVFPADEATNRMTVLGPYEDRTAAKLYAGLNGYALETASDVIWSGRVLVEVYNAISGTHIKKFESRDVGVRRLLEALPTVAREPAPVTLATASEGKMAKSENGTGKRGRQSKYKPDMTITVLADKNPKRAGSKAAARFELYHSGMTVADFVAAGGTVTKLALDVNRGQVSVG